MNSNRRLGIGAGLIAVAVSVVSVAVYLVFLSSEPLPTAAEIALLNAEATQDLAESCLFLAASDDQYYGTAQRA
jgi:tetratricopeptide (TPR) repeat protein